MQAQRRYEADNREGLLSRRRRLERRLEDFGPERRRGEKSVEQKRILEAIKKINKKLRKISDG